MNLKRPEFSDLDACIVDLDGTLVDTLGDFEVALNHMLATLDRPPVTRALIEQLVGKGSEHLIRAVLAHVELQRGVVDFVASDDLFQRAWGAYQQHYLRINGRHSTVYAGAIEGLHGAAGRGASAGLPDQQAHRFCAAAAAVQGAGWFFHRSIWRRCFCAQEARSAAAARDLHRRWAALRGVR